VPGWRSPRGGGPSGPLQLGARQLGRSILVSWRGLADSGLTNGHPEYPSAAKRSAGQAWGSQTRHLRAGFVVTAMPTAIHACPGHSECHLMAAAEPGAACACRNLRRVMGVGVGWDSVHRVMLAMRPLPLNLLLVLQRFVEGDEAHPLAALWGARSSRCLKLSSINR